MPASDENVSWSNNAIEHVLKITGGYPYFLQEFGKQAWDLAAGPENISLDDVLLSIPVATAELDDGFFRVRIGRTNDQERNYLRAMAELGSGPVRSGDVAKLLKRNASTVAPVRDGLLKKSLCYSPRWGEIEFTVPMFDEFMKRWIPELRS